MVIEPLKKEDGSIYTNVEICKAMYEGLKQLRDHKDAINDREAHRSEDAFYRICGGSSNANEIMDFLEQINEAKSYEEAQDLIARGLIPVKSK